MISAASSPKLAQSSLEFVLCLRSTRCNVSGEPPAALQLSQQIEATHQNESDQRKQDAAITVQVAVKEPNVDLCGEEPKRHNANRVREHRNRNGQERQVDLQGFSGSSEGKCGHRFPL